MESIYLGIVLFLFLLAIFDLVVGVSNDAVNFLGSAVGARAASFKWIMGVAAVGILCGAVMSNGMMDVARHGIFRPEQFYFQDIMCICLAVMAIDVILLDTFNTLGLPTSTTVSIVFELLGGAFALAMVKLAADDTGLTFADMLNSEKALSVIMAIFLSVAIAFVFGAVVQYIARLIFTFNYKSHMKWSAALFGGVAMTAIIYFILIKGMKDSSFMTPELSEWISTYTRHLVAGCFIDAVPALLIFAPIFCPTAEAYGIDMVHFGVVMVIVLCIGLATPPVGINLYVASSVGGQPVHKIIPHLPIPLLAITLGTVIVVLIPQITTLLPALVNG